MRTTARRLLLLPPPPPPTTSQTTTPTTKLAPAPPPTIAPHRQRPPNQPNQPPASQVGFEFNRQHYVESNVICNMFDHLPYAAMPAAHFSNGSTTPTPPSTTDSSSPPPPTNSTATATATTTNNHHPANHQLNSQSPVAEPSESSAVADHEASATAPNNTNHSPPPSSIVPTSVTAGNCKYSKDLSGSDTVVDLFSASTTPPLRLTANATTAIDAIKREPADDAGAKPNDAGPQPPIKGMSVVNTRMLRFYSVDLGYLQ